MDEYPCYSPSFLIAVPQLLDPNFYHAVVLLIEHSKDGAMGLTINHPTEHSIKSVYEQLGRLWGGAEDLRLMRGGPVQPERAWILHGPECQASPAVSGHSHQVIGPLIAKSDDFIGGSTGSYLIVRRYALGFQPTALPVKVGFHLLVLMMVLRYHLEKGEPHFQLGGHFTYKG